MQVTERCLPMHCFRFRRSLGVRRGSDRPSARTQQWVGDFEIWDPPFTDGKRLLVMEDERRASLAMLTPGSHELYDEQITCRDQYEQDGSQFFKGEEYAKGGNRRGEPNLLG